MAHASFVATAILHTWCKGQKLLADVDVPSIQRVRVSELAIKACVLPIDWKTSLIEV